MVLPVAFTNPFVNSAATCQILLTNGTKNQADQETFSYTYVQRKNYFTYKINYSRPNWNKNPK
jgi:hypothetical protein